MSNNKEKKKQANKNDKVVDLNKFHYLTEKDKEDFKKFDAFIEKKRSK